MSERAFPSRSWWQVFLGWPRAVRWSAYGVVGLVLLLVAGLVTAVVLVRRPFPQVEGSVRVPGLTGEVEVVRDERGIPQLYADTTADLMAAQGYVQAQERFYEMDVRRHTTAGRLSELFGPDTLEIDEFVRTLGWRRGRRAGAAAAGARDPGRARGVRRRGERLPRGPQPVGDRRAVHRPRPRRSRLPPRAVDALSTRWPGSRRWPGTSRATSTRRSSVRWSPCDHTPEQVAELFPAYDYEAHAPIVGGGAVVDGVFEPDAEEGGTRNPERPAFTADQRAQLAGLHRTLERLPSFVGRGDGVGSNSWVVDGEHSETGEPLLANDPHLGVSMPGIWMQMGLHCTTVSSECPLDVAGFTFSGVPGVIIGHNADIAWGFTNLGPDVTDLYLERVTGDEWVQDGRPRPLIDPRGDHPRARRGRRTAAGARHGARPDHQRRLRPLRRPGRQCRPAPRAVSLAWTALTPSRTADAIFDLNIAHRLDELPRGRLVVRRARAEHRVRRPRRPHRLPGSRPGPDPQVRATTASSRRRAGAARTTGPATTCRSRVCPTCSTPTRASW